MPGKSKKKNKCSICHCLIATHDRPCGPGKCAKRDIASGAKSSLSAPGGARFYVIGAWTTTCTQPDTITR